MKRLAFSFSVAVATLGLGACEKQSSATLPEQYQNKWAPKHAEAEQEKPVPPEGEKEKAPAAEHKG